MILLLSEHHEFHQAGCRFACIGEIAVGCDTSGRGSLQGSRFQNRTDSLIFWRLFSSTVSRSYAIGMLKRLRAMNNPSEAV